MRRVVVLPDADAVAQSAAARLLLAVQDALASRGIAHIVLTGGTVGIATLEAVGLSPLARAIDWTSVHVWWGDERFVPAGDPERNEGQAQAALLGGLPLPEENVHRVSAADGVLTAEQAADAYVAELGRFGGHSPAFDVLLLGLGPDAHVASLFPGHPGLQSPATALAVHDSPKPPPTRVSLGLATINGARRVWIVAAGAGKAEAVRASLAKDGGVPGGMVSGTDETLWLVDAAAATRV